MYPVFEWSDFGSPLYFDTNGQNLKYNDSYVAVDNRLELVCLPGETIEDNYCIGASFCTSLQTLHNSNS